jgi:molybdopterin synthase sulfur carrier subunit
MLKVLYFASLRETLGTSQEEVPVPVPANVGALISELCVRGDCWAQALAAGKRWRVAVNQEMATRDTQLCAGDEVAIFPPVTGG